MNEVRKNAVGVKFLLNGRIAVEECRELAIQELIFLIHSAKHFRKEQTLTGQDADEKIRSFFTVLKEKVKDAEALYLAYDKHTNYPYVDADDRVWMFSNEQYAASAEDYFRQQLLMLEMKKIGREEILGTFAELHILGLSKVLLDNGQYHIEIDGDDILPPPDWTGIPEINIPVTNPRLQHALIRFFQTLHSRQDGETDKQLLHALEGQMLEEVLRAKYLLPMQLLEKKPAPSDEQGIKTIAEGTEIRFGVLGAENDSTWLPAFTDWPEFEKVYDKTVWSSNVAAFGDLLALSENMNGIVVNCAGIPLRIDENNKKAIEAYIRGRNEAEARE
ncbi:SseB family protein [Paenibacillus sp. VCA1]|uniref:SseB family protein n=1 Tax=Paenibacillus sp. VCA1 TaxID=3039148 RepID=UPI0028713724|nr:SseB family protein [Paenibacillus sp. VCA1]MDR9853619.1 SseB family protein [Paenibacillus sp. VCA1]